MPIQTNHQAIIIGAGGVGSWLLPLLVRLIGPSAITIYDGDTLEEKNLDRQLFDPSMVGTNKAVALAEKYPGIAAFSRFVTPGMLQPRSRDVLFCCADNDAARKAALETCDTYRCTVIIGANEYTDAEAYLYQREWRGTTRDPRVFYPNIQTNQADDPTRPDGCQGEAAVASPQLAPANYLAAGLMVHLYEYHKLTLAGADKPDAVTYPDIHHPIHHRVSFAGFRTVRGSDRPLLSQQQAA